MRKIFLLLLMPLFYWAQFNQSVSTSPEFCNGDGKAKVSITNTTTGATLEFLIYKLPDSSSPYRTISGNTTTGSTYEYEEVNLPAGDYTWVTNENLNGNTTTKNTAFKISNNFKPLVFSFDISDKSCGLTNIVVNTTQGSPATYTLNTTSGSNVRPEQTSNIFSNVPAGAYNIVVKDVCGNAVAKSVTLAAETNNYTFNRAATNQLGFNYLSSCDTFSHSIQIKRNNSLVIPSDKFPINITYEITAPDGSVTTKNYTMNNASDNGMVVTDVPFYYNQNFSIKATLVDHCGNTYTQTDNISTATMRLDYRLLAGNCGVSYVSFNPYYAAPAYKITFESYPSDFKPWEYSSNFPNGSYTGTFTDVPSFQLGNANNGLPSGNYTVKLSDDCGHSYTRTFKITSETKLYADIPNQGVTPRAASDYLLLGPAIPK
ncbi:hypothetical protein [Riemerella columbina]|uniref:hypothetical protein n=1 Tax=Riemerella columbina TaxID=103810 RepID=UPI00266F2356|nr:hypothetical protein [Riemerella columbina]WKS94975.1 hypothetical protein NYR17_08610 [Riemerella columbina]